MNRSLLYGVCLSVLFVYFYSWTIIFNSICISSKWNKRRSICSSRNLICSSKNSRNYRNLSVVSIKKKPKYNITWSYFMICCHIWGTTSISCGEKNLSPRKFFIRKFTIIIRMISKYSYFSSISPSLFVNLLVHWFCRRNLPYPPAKSISS